MALSPSVKARFFFAKDQPLDSSTGGFCKLNWKPALGLALSSLIQVKDWNKPREHFATPQQQTSQCGHKGKPHLEEQCPYNCEGRGTVKPRLHDMASKQKLKGMSKI